MKRFGPFFSSLCCANTTGQRQYEYLLLTSFNDYPEPYWSVPRFEYSVQVLLPFCNERAWLVPFQAPANHT